MVPAATLHATLSGMAAVGLDAAAIADGAGVAGWDRAPPPGDAVAPPDAFGRVWSAAFRARPRPELPAVVGAAVPFGAFGLTDHLVGSAPTLGAGLEALAEHARLVAAASQFEVERPVVWIETGPSEVGMGAWSHPRAVGDLFTVAVVAARFRARLPDGRPSEVHLVHADVDPRPFADVLGAPVRLGQSRSGLALPAAAWSAPLDRADVGLHATLDALARSAAVERYAARPLAHAVRARLAVALAAGAASAADLADGLGLSLRTFQRRLAGEGTSFALVLDEYRRDQSARLLDAGLPVGEVAAQLGYSEPTSLTRAFRRWHGAPPSRRGRDAGRT